MHNYLSQCKHQAPKRKRTARNILAARLVKVCFLYQIGSGTQFLNLPTVVPGAPMPEQTGLP